LDEKTLKSLSFYGVNDLQKSPKWENYKSRDLFLYTHQMVGPTTLSNRHGRIGNEVPLINGLN